MTELTMEEREVLQSKRQLVQNYTRCCGWLVPKESGNPGKQQEYADRNNYLIDKSLEHEVNRLNGVALEQEYNI
jgi:hypothetical protein